MNRSAFPPLSLRAESLVMLDRPDKTARNEFWGLAAGLAAWIVVCESVLFLLLPNPLIDEPGPYLLGALAASVIYTAGRLIRYDARH